MSECGNVSITDGVLDQTGIEGESLVSRNVSSSSNWGKTRFTLVNRVPENRSIAHPGGLPNVRHHSATNSMSLKEYLFVSFPRWEKPRTQLLAVSRPTNV